MQKELRGSVYEKKSHMVIACVYFAVGFIMQTK